MKRRDLLAALGSLAAAPAAAQTLKLAPAPIVPGAGDVLVNVETSLGVITIAALLSTMIYLSKRAKSPFERALKH